MAEQHETHRKQMVGTVTSDKMMRTAVVKVTTSKTHPLYHKQYRWTKKYLSDTGELQVKIGDTVKIEASRPLSKLKRWVVVEVLSSANQTEVKAVKKAAAKSKTTVAKKKAK